jgi:aspartate racemase
MNIPATGRPLSIPLVPGANGTRPSMAVPAPQRRTPGVIGILGGMGPLASVDLLNKIIDETPADRDQDHVPVVVASIPQIPSRIDALTRSGPSPLPAMLDVLRRLERAGAGAIAMPCNTAHAWYEKLAAQTGLPILHIVACALAELAAGETRVGVLASAGTIKTALYSRPLRGSGREPVELSAFAQSNWVDPAIELVKAGRVDEATELLRPAARQLAQRGAQAIILACTELPIAMAGVLPQAPARHIDATRALARACVAWSRGLETSPRGFVIL